MDPDEVIYSSSLRAYVICPATTTSNGAVNEDVRFLEKYM